MISKDKLIFDAADLAASDDVGAYLRASDGTLLTHTDVGGKKALDVNVANSISATIAPGSEIKITDGTDDLAINADGSINAVVSATDLDIRDLAFATDKVDVTGSEVSLDAATLAALENISAVVTATDLDIRDLNHAQDNVAIAQGGNTMAVNADGSINVNADISVVNGSDKVEDSAHASGDIGTYVLAVREDVLAASTSASGDYSSLKVDALGRLHTVDAAQDAVFSAVTVTNSATDLVASDLANRRKILIQNVSTRTVYIGESGVTTATGIRLSAGSSMELEAGPQVDLHAIAQGGSADVRVLELA